MWHAPPPNPSERTHYLDVIPRTLEEGNAASAQRALRAEYGGDLQQLQLHLLAQARDVGIASPEPVNA